jgi:hypothetical protein
MVLCGWVADAVDATIKSAPINLETEIQRHTAKFDTAPTLRSTFSAPSVARRGIYTYDGERWG